MTGLEVAISDELLRKVAQKYHYHEEDMQELRQVADVLEEVLQGRSGFWCRLPEAGQPGNELPEAGQPGNELPEARLPGNEPPAGDSSGNGRIKKELQGSGQKPAFAEVVMTLGAGVDDLQNQYMDAEEFCECYMVEVIGNELLLECYVRFNEWIAVQSGWHVARYHFFGSRDDFPLEGMKEVLDRCEDTVVTCNEAYCLVPKMSVVFVAELTRDEKQVCEGICMGCGNRACPNRMGAAEEAPRWPDVPQRVLPYGYTKILESAGSRQ